LWHRQVTKPRGWRFRGILFSSLEIGLFFSMMYFEDRKNGYTLEFPDDWKERKGNFGTLSHHSVLFGAVGDKYSFESGDGRSKLTLSAGANIWPGRLFRRAAMVDFLVFNVFLDLKETDIREVEGYRLGGEENTVSFRYESPHGNGRFISAVRQGREYTLRTSVLWDETTEQRMSVIEVIISSFRFLK
jgi:hypothetical protein